MRRKLSRLIFFVSIMLVLCSCVVESGYYRHHSYYNGYPHYRYYYYDYDYPHGYYYYRFRAH